MFRQTCLAEALPFFTRSRTAIHIDALFVRIFFPATDKETTKAPSLLNTIFCMHYSAVGLGDPTIPRTALTLECLVDARTDF